MPEGEIARELGLGLVGSGVIGKRDGQAHFGGGAEAGIELVVELCGDLTEPGGEAADPQRFEGILQRLDQRADLFDVRAQFLEALRGGGDQGCDLGFGRHMAEVEAEANPHAAHASVEADGVVARLDRKRAPVAWVGPCHDVQGERRVPHST